jgi:hypothetical protein
MSAAVHETPVDTVDTVDTGDAEVTDLELVRAQRAADAQKRRAAARSRDLTALLRERPDLVGVHAPADFAVDAVSWSALPGDRGAERTGHRRRPMPKTPRTISRVAVRIT